MRFERVAGIDKPISRILQGCMMMRAEEIDAGFALLDAAYQRGINAFDTAHGYGLRTADRVLGAWVRSRGVADEVVLLGKGCHPNEQGKRVRPENIAADIGDTLQRMDLPTLDLWAFHRDDPAVPVGELVDACNAEINAGRIRAYGGSNWSLPRVNEARVYARDHDLVPMTFTSPHFSLAEQIDSPFGDDCVTISGPSHVAERDWHREHQVPAFAWSSLARGFFSGAFGSSIAPALREGLDANMLRCYGSDDNWQRLARAEELAAERGWTVPQVALVWVLNQDFPVLAITGGQRPEEVTANVTVADETLTPAEIAWLDLRTERE